MQFLQIFWNMIIHLFHRILRITFNSSQDNVFDYQAVHNCQRNSSSKLDLNRSCLATSLE